MPDFREFSSPDEVYLWAKRVYSQNVLDTFDINKIHYLSPLSLYRNSSYETMNQHLRKGILCHPELHTEYLQHDLCKQCLPESVVVYRFLSFKEILYLWRKTLFGREFEYPAFLSTTLDKNHYRGTSKSSLYIKIHANKNVHAMYLPGLKEAPVQEYELLFAHHVTLKRRSFWEYEIVAKEIPKAYQGVQQPAGWLAGKDDES